MESNMLKLINTFIKEKTEWGSLELSYIPTSRQTMDIFRKALSRVSKDRYAIS